MARYIHDFVSGCHFALDDGLSSTESEKRQGRQISKDSVWSIFRYPGSLDILLHTAQGPPCGRRYVRCSIGTRKLTDGYQAYTTYAFFEWALVLLDVGFDAVTALDFDTLELVVRDVKGTSQGYVQRLPK